MSEGTRTAIVGKFGVTANAIAPGSIETEMTAATAARMGIDFDALKKSAAGQIPVNRIGQPEDAATIASFLAGDGAGFISGQVIYVAGGRRTERAHRGAPATVGRTEGTAE
jgi:3-oxoacyl-[acyl-carrier protein] reductase